MNQCARFLAREWSIFLHAVSFFTRLPAYRLIPYSADAQKQSIRYFPAVGYLAGLCMYAGLMAGQWAGLPEAGAVLALALPILLTGALHEDGFADSCDGLGGGRDKAHRLAIMKDSSSGVFAVVGIVLLILFKYQCLAKIGSSQALPLLVSIHSLSRLPPSFTMRFLGYARTEGSKSQPLVCRFGWGQLAFAVLLSAAPLLWLGEARSLLLVPACWLPALLFTWFAQRKIGGYTGDTLGAGQQLAEAGGLLMAASLQSAAWVWA